MRAAALHRLEEAYVLRVRIRFSKYDTMRFIGHLDVMRYFQKLFNRAGLPVKYSEGYHPHQILSFAQPLGLGITSDGEYLDLELTEEIPCEEIVSVLNKAVSYGFEISEAVRLGDREPNKKLVTAMSLITRSVYLMILKDAFENEERSETPDFYTTLGRFLGQDEIRAVKKTKKGEKEVFLSDFIYEVWDYTEDNLRRIFLKDGVNTAVDDELVKRASVHAPDFENNRKFIVSLSAGSETNISPDLFLQSYLDFLAQSGTLQLKVSDFRIHRMELLGGECDRSVSLCRIL